MLNPEGKYFHQEYFGILQGAQEMLRNRYTVGSFQHAQLSGLAGPEQESKVFGRQVTVSEDRAGLLGFTECQYLEGK